MRIGDIEFFIRHAKKTFHPMQRRCLVQPGIFTVIGRSHVLRGLVEVSFQGISPARWGEYALQTSSSGSYALHHVRLEWNYPQQRGGSMQIDGTILGD